MEVLLLHFFSPSCRACKTLPFLCNVHKGDVNWLGCIQDLISYSLMVNYDEQPGKLAPEASVTGRSYPSAPEASVC